MDQSIVRSGFICIQKLGRAIVAINGPEPIDFVFFYPQPKGSIIMSVMDRILCR